VAFLRELRPAWMADALCLEHPEVNFFPARGHSIAEAKALCGRCLVQRECREYALADDALVGVWGGTSTQQREQLRRASKLSEVA